MTTKDLHARPESSCATRHDTIACTAVLATMVLSALIGAATLALDPAFDAAARSVQENRHV